MITASLVIYNNDPAEFGRAISSFLNSTSTGEIWVSDNSPQPLKNELFDNPRVHYHFNDRNLGFGAGHNKVIELLPSSTDFHLFLNPDIYFDPQVLQALEDIMQHDREIGAVMPRISYPDGSLQRLAKLLPTPMDLIFRRFLPFIAMKATLNNRYELHGIPQDSVIEVPSISGCFLLVRRNVLRRVGGFDERYFMYMEDVDLVRQIGDTSKVMYVPMVNVVHGYAKGSYGNSKLLLWHVKSAIKYFNKWGWFSDRQRSLRNNAMLDRLSCLRGAQEKRGA
ncbi:glycosyltransferase family 2 protein [Sulfitobacter sp. 1A16787]|uniref:glycosyltransferase family 2 protein n=1 Tax=Sulfitobacter sp. 1A16787 TaxID=3368571 RepID=UPI0037475A6C